ncbi:MAG: Holliday junction branch migration protein RuvA [Bacillales bacterium]|jgi:Holliday junction DNA helicase RuvA|nr:Holliday junction branch migration protein RuvA [Bacillales bacterium]
MFQYLNGIISEKGLDYLVVDVGGVGYYVTISSPNNFFLGTSTKVYIYHSQKEDGVTLFGFVSLEEKLIFLKLLQVSGIGPKSASTILGAISVNNLIIAIENGDLKLLKKLPGIGAKTASQIILDLKGKLIMATEVNKNENINPELEDAISGLLGLGYKKNEIDSLMKELSKENLTSIEYIKKALSIIGKAK